MSTEMVAGLAIALIAGSVAGAFYFGSLWLTLRKLDKVRRPLMFLAISSALRLGLVFAALILAVVAGATIWHILAALAGFFAFRQLLIVRMRIQNA
jgi:F1F0 ATPase subunit 2